MFLYCTNTQVVYQYNFMCACIGKGKEVHVVLRRGGGFLATALVLSDIVRPWNGVGPALPFAHSFGLWVEARGLGCLRIADLNVLAPLVNGGSARHAHTTRTLAGTAGSVKTEKKIRTDT